MSSLSYIFWGLYKLTHIEFEFNLILRISNVQNNIYLLFKLLVFCLKPPKFTMEGKTFLNSISWRDSGHNFNNTFLLKWHLGFTTILFRTFVKSWMKKISSWLFLNMGSPLKWFTDLFCYKWMKKINRI